MRAVGLHIACGSGDNLVYGDPAFTFNIPGGNTFNGMFSFSMTAPPAASVKPESQNGYSVTVQKHIQGQSMSVTVNVSARDRKRRTPR